MRDKVYDVKTKTYKMIRQQLKCIPYRQIPKETEHLILMENEIEEIPGELFETHVNLKTLEDGKTFSADVLLVSVGRGPVSANLGYEEQGISMDRGYVLVDDKCRTIVTGKQIGRAHV